MGMNFCRATNNFTIQGMLYLPLNQNGNRFIHTIADDLTLQCTNIFNFDHY